MPLRFRRFPFLSAAILALLTARLSWAGRGSGESRSRPRGPLVRHRTGPVASPPPGTGQGRRTSGLGPLRGVRDAIARPLVYFLSESRRVDEAAIRDCVSSALGIRFQVNDPDADTFVIPFSRPDRKKSDSHIRHFMVRIPDGLFAVLVSDRPYIDNPKDFARATRSGTTPPLRRRAAPRVDLGRSHGRSHRSRGGPARLSGHRENPRLHGRPRLPRDLLPRDATLQRIRSGLIETLSGPDPLDLFEEPTFEPVIEISDNNPGWPRRCARPSTRWPEFVAAFEGSPLADRDRYIVKAEFREGKKAEYMWVSVGGNRPGRRHRHSHE